MNHVQHTDCLPSVSKRGLQGPYARAESSSRFTTFEPLLSATAVAEMLCLHPVTLLRWAREGRVPHHRLGRRVVFRLSELEMWLSLGQPTEDHRAAA